MCAVLATSGPSVAERKVYTEVAPWQLRAIGQLTVPGQELVDGHWRSRNEHCSAALVSERLILSAWHCLDYYEDLSRTPLFTLVHADTKEAVTARPVASGGSMRADWALLRLSKPLASVTPLRVEETGHRASPLILAGYARDAGLGENGTVLTYQTDCRRLEPRDGQWSTNCVTFSGASGGPVLQSGAIVGVISRGDSRQRTYFAPSEQFLSAYRAFVH